jgi:hypothetical protein
LPLRETAAVGPNEDPYNDILINFNKHHRYEHIEGVYEYHQGTAKSAV